MAVIHAARIGGGAVSSDVGQVVVAGVLTLGVMHLGVSVRVAAPEIRALRARRVACGSMSLMVPSVGFAPPTCQTRG